MSHKNEKNIWVLNKIPPLNIVQYYEQQNYSIVKLRIFYIGMMLGL